MEYCGHNPWKTNLNPDYFPDTLLGRCILTIIKYKLNYLDLGLINKDLIELIENKLKYKCVNCKLILPEITKKKRTYIKKKDKVIHYDYCIDC